MIGAIIGDIVGSRFEFKGDRIKTKEFDLFTPDNHITDDTVMTIATADCLMNDPTLNFTKYYQEWGRKYPTVGYGGTFHEWIYLDNPQPYNSYGNGSAMRVSPVAYVVNSVDELVPLAARSAEVTHNHPEGIRGASATAYAIWLAMQKLDKKIIRYNISNIFNYDLYRHSDEIRKTYKFDVSCQGSVPESIISFLDGNDFEDVIRIAVSLGGDSDTIACIAGAIAEAYYGVPDWMVEEAKSRMTDEILVVYNQFKERYGSR